MRKIVAKLFISLIGAIERNFSKVADTLTLPINSIEMNASHPAVSK